MASLKELIAQNEGINSEPHNYYKLHVKFSDMYGPKTVVLYQMGNFYEVPGFDVGDITYTNYKTIAAICSTKIMRRDKPCSYTAPRGTGFQVHNSEKYVNTLLDHDYTIVFVDQVPDTDPVERRVTNILTPTTSDTHCESNSTILSLFCEGVKRTATFAEREFSVGYSIINTVTGDIRVGELYTSKTDRKKILDDMQWLLSFTAPSEIIIRYAQLSDGEDLMKLFDRHSSDFITTAKKVYCNTLHKGYYEEAVQEDILCEAYKSDFDIFSYLGITQYNLATVSLVNLIVFLKAYNPIHLKTLKRPTLSTDDVMVLENTAVKHLHLFSEDTPLNLFTVVDRTTTKGGKRLLRERITYPITDGNKIRERYEQVDSMITLFTQNPQLTTKVKGLLKHLRAVDLENLLLRVRKERITLLEYEKLVTGTLCAVDTLETNILENENVQVDKIKELISECNSTIDPDGEITFVKSGISVEIDQSVATIVDSKKYLNKVVDDLTNLCTECSKRGLKFPVVLTKDYIKLTNAGYNAISKHKRRLSIAYRQGEEALSFEKFNSQHYITSQKITRLIKQVQIFQERVNKYSSSIYSKIIKRIKEHSDELLALYTFVNTIDVTLSNAQVALENSYSKPTVVASDQNFINAQALRNPICEKLVSEIYVPNDVQLGTAYGMRGMVLFSLNGCGKSNLLKAIAYNLIMAQAGMYCSAANFEYTPYHNIFTRIGSKDDDQKRSSFQVECLDIRSILHRSTKKSFVILDEIVVTTENESAVSISYAVIEKLHSLQATFMFATHLTPLKDLVRFESVKIYHIDTIFTPERIEYVRKLQPGPAPTLYGIEVMKYIYDDSQFINSALRVRDSLTKTGSIGPTPLPENTSDFSVPKVSRYNKKRVIKQCSLCYTKHNLHTHHIHFQRDANEWGNINHFNKNTKGNTVVLCEWCHEQLHSSGSFTLKWVTTPEGVELKKINL